MSKQHDGGPAFPQHLIETSAGAIEASYNAPDGAGMTLRDYFAAAALTGMLAAVKKAPEHPTDTQGFVDGAACTAYMVADAMLKARGA